MFCEKCGTKNADDSKFCENCGNPLANNAANEETQENNNVFETSGMNNVQTDEGLEADNENMEKAGTAADTLNSVSEEVNEAQANQEQSDVFGANPLEQRKKTPVKLIAGICAGAVVLIAAIVTIVILLVGSKPAINLNDYIKFDEEGYDGYGSLEASIDWDAIEDKYGDDLKFTGDAKDKYDYLLDMTEPIEALESYISVEIDKSSDLKNGDEIKYKWKVNKNAEKLVKCKIEYENGTYKVSGLKKVETFDAFEAVTVEFSGTSPNGYAYFSFNGSVLSRYEFSISETSGLKNGDVIKVSLYDTEAENYIESYGKLPETFEKEFKVEGLDEYTQSYSDLSEDFLDELKEAAKDKVISSAENRYRDDVEITEPEYAGYIFKNRKENVYGNYNELYIIYTADVSSEDGDFATTKVYYPVCFRNIMKSGDSYEYNESIYIEGSSNICDSSSYSTLGYVNTLKCYLELVDEDKDSYDAECGDGVETYDDFKIVTKLEDINEENGKDIIEDAKKRIEAYVARDYDETSKVSDLELVGQYFVSARESEDLVTDSNGYVVVYSGKASSTNGRFDEVTVYFPVIYYGVVKVSDDKVMAAEFDDIAGLTYFEETAIGTKGYTDGKEMFEELISDGSDDFKYEMTEGLKKFGELK